MPQTKVLTVGHANHSLEQFIALLGQHDVTAVADVRWSPNSRYGPQFNEATLAQALKASGITHISLGRELGTRPDDKACYEYGRVQYRRLAKTELFNKGLDRVIKSAATHRIALMCAEKEPLDCHRTLLVGRELAARGAAVSHILADGSLETHAQTMARLLQIAGLAEHDPLRSEDEKLDGACAWEEERVAYVDESG